MEQTAPQTALLRAPSDVMRLARLGASFPTRLSFLRTLLRRLSDEDARVARTEWCIDENGFGHAVYSVPLGGHTYSLVAFSHDLPPEARTDRVIAEAWDSTYVLYDGIPDAADIDRLRSNAPKQEAGRFSPKELVLSRANKSVRLFAHVVDALRAGHQPDAGMIARVGYLMRTTAVYGNGKFGIADRAAIAGRPGLGGPFMAEMLTVWLIRTFTHDLVEHLGGAPLDRGLKRILGIGNSTGLGMAPFLVSHPVLLHNWIAARETALARVRGLDQITPEDAARLLNLADRAARHLDEWEVPDTDHQARIAALRADWAQMRAGLNTEALTAPGAVDRLLELAQRLGLDAQELTAAWLLEPFGTLIDDLTGAMACGPEPRLDPAMSTARLRDLIEEHFGWALPLDYDNPEHCGQFWYVSEAKLEPRLGDRHAEEGAERESPLDIARRVQALHRALDGTDERLATFLMAHPRHRSAARRVQIAARHPYSEIRDNLIASTCLPIDMLRAKLAFFGASKFDPKSDRWTRITLCQGAPLADELAGADDWWLPVCGS